VGEYFDRTAAAAWQALTSEAPLSRVRETVRAGRDRMRGTLLGWLPPDLSGRRVLDAGCGTGQLAVELARRGAEVVAVDLSPTLVAHARERAAAAGVAVRFHAGDMLDPALGHFDLMVAMDSLIHYELPDAMHALAALAPRVREQMLLTLVPRTPLLLAMRAVGRLFPRQDRAPAVVPVAVSAFRRALLDAPGMDRWGLVTTRTIHAGFYRSSALVLRHGAFRHGGAATGARPAEAVSFAGGEAWR
jgi:magnesium-protoporphyrin O-methyltransferase